MEPMDIVASDIMGPFKKANINSGCWVLTIQDISSTYGECHIIATKADAAAVLQAAITRWEVKCGRNLKTLHTDGGGKFWSKGMNHLCSMKGITHEQSLPIHHKQNGVAEHCGYGTNTTVIVRFGKSFLVICIHVGCIHKQ
ncbi:hypothetical protein O181_026539 [Austropuccinia psidii MF-1]|uniref:Integrase catalytic domain-containing protein n=1 Tax=Austropuccinia psidii MF-1 TaxID=1389203 RepID=A0A9Q3CK59_9BASI|nr:hypothetical protein [Austropuccinia psidii MF-1]